MIASSCCFCAIIFLTNSCAISGCAFRYNFTNCVVVSSSIARLTGNESTAPPGTPCIPNCIGWPCRGSSCGLVPLSSSGLLPSLFFHEYTCLLQDAHDHLPRQQVQEHMENLAPPPLLPIL